MEYVMLDIEVIKRDIFMLLIGLRCFAKTKIEEDNRK